MRATFTFGSLICQANSLWVAKFEAVSKFKAGAQAAKSLKLQKSYLRTAKKELARGNVKGAKALLEAWKLERAYYAHILNRLGVFSIPA